MKARYAKPFRRRVRHLLNQFGFDISRFQSTGSAPLIDMKGHLDNNRPVIFDVGANTGQSVQKFREIFPKSVIHSFEPSPSTFPLLQQYLSNLRDTHAWNLALGAEPGEFDFYENSSSDMSSFLPLGKDGWGAIVDRPSVKMETLDRFARQHDISRIDILKIDTQGFDLEVLKGAEQSIMDGCIKLAYLEIIFSDLYEGAPAFSDVCAFLQERDFRLVSFYDFHYQDGLARWADALFLHAP